MAEDSITGQGGEKSLKQWEGQHVAAMSRLIFESNHSRPEKVEYFISGVREPNRIAKF
jgi:hypothetical protein